MKSLQFMTMNEMKSFAQTIASDASPENTKFCKKILCTLFQYCKALGQDFEEVSDMLHYLIAAESQTTKVLNQLVDFQKIQEMYPANIRLACYVEAKTGLDGCLEQEAQYEYAM